jgi:hypothetical protein
MSHYGILVLVDQEHLERAAAEDAVGPLLEAYDENLKVAEHRTDCWCVGRKAREESHNAVWTSERVAERDAMRDEFHKVRKRFEKLGHGELDVGMIGSPWGPEWSEVIDELPPSPAREKFRTDVMALEGRWKALFDEIHAEQDAAEKAHPEYHKPDPECESCHGDGHYMTTANEQGYWDWWTIGGRWTSAVDPEYEPGQDPRNYGPCRFCPEVKGKRFWRKVEEASKPKGLEGIAAEEGENGMFVRWEQATKDDPLAEEQDCNVCHGTGTERHFRNADHDGDVRPVSVLPDGWEGNFYALVTPDGRWHQQGTMGWWGLSSDEMDEPTWREYLRTEVAKYPRASAVVVDAHI